MFTPAARLRHTFCELESAMAALSGLITQAADAVPVNACCFPLPDVASGNEHEPVTQIEVSRLDDAAAITAALDGYRQWYIRPGCSTKASFRLPGYLVLPTALKPELQALTEDINRLKGEFRAQVQEAEGRDKKFALVHDTLPGLITLQVYRHLVLLPHSVSRLGFTWANKQIIQKIDKDKLVKQLSDARLSPPPLTDAETWIQCVDREIYDVKRLPPGVELRLRRPVKTHPMVNVRWSEELTPRQQQVKAHLPLLLCQDELPAVTALGNYPPSTTRKRRAARITDEPLIPRLHIYPYRPES
ncbi:DNA replication terminus site-binding protein [Oceanisphaera arctica]|uniref:DNA replication terminus site-binding protein n=1 Tax=Oceanisphaera arctica TaxID=641510 RepID=A0A2P5TQL9_9GAMM|nr:DNA replication terminus site-binding protein [Oceanisphaera arctica]PPL18072.1 DNA replication terminus site-binding protein [Oceanisphaera arctica]GHA09619.1 DNA replication terminus site-binding protein [Oceanisphaera arctica]